MGKAEPLMVLWLAEHVLGADGLVTPGDDIVQQVVTGSDARKVAHLGPKRILIF